jgi:hypothetical protein
VKQQTLVNYKLLKAEKKALTKYLQELEKLTDKDLSNFNVKQKLAFWLNAYNAYTLKVVVDHYPVKSIKDITDGGLLNGLLRNGPWKIDSIKLLGKTLSLDYIEHSIIRPIFKEPRIHFAVNCASIGCPSLLREPFRADKLEQQLEKVTTNFLNNNKKNYLKNNIIYISKIFDWYEEDFKAKKGVKVFIQKYLPDVKLNYKIKYLNYDWNINHYSK